MSFPIQRMRRLRQNEQIRRMVRENKLSVDNLIYPLFAVHGTGVQEPIPSLPGVYHLSVDRLVEEAKQVYALGIPAVLLFGIPLHKDSTGSEAFDEHGISQQALTAIKSAVPDLVLIADSCSSLYTPGGHSGILNNGVLDNDQSLDILTRIAVTQAKAGADIIAPSAMLDGQIGAIRKALDDNDFKNTCIMSYAAKFASQLYDPFFKLGEEVEVSYTVKRTHQIDCANADEAIRDAALDIEEGADILMVKPGGFCLDIVYRCKKEFSLPLAVYQVSGEYAMIHAAADRKYIDRQAMMHESLIAIRRAGADMIITYFAKDIAEQL